MPNFDAIALYPQSFNIDIPEEFCIVVLLNIYTYHLKQAMKYTRQKVSL